MLQISKPQLGETIPGHVHCTIEVDVSRFVGEIREEWESLRDHDGTYEDFNHHAHEHY